MADIALNYTQREAFRGFHTRKERWSVLLCHRRAGKSFACIHELIIRALYTTKHNPQYFYLAPFYSQAKNIAWQYLKEATQDFAIKVMDSELSVTLPNNAKIRLVGADNPDSIRGLYADGVILDEFADMRPSLWGSVVLPLLADRKGWAVLAGTIKGKNHLWKAYDRAEKTPSWFSINIKASASHILDEEELLEMKREMSPEQYMQEMENDPTAAVLGTYYAQLVQLAEAELRIAKKPQLYNPDLNVYAAADLGYSDSTAFWFWQETPTGEVKVIDYYENQGQPLSHYVSMLQNKPYHYEIIWLPHDAKAKTLQTGRTVIEQLTRPPNKLPCQIVPRVAVQDGIEAVRLMLPHVEIDADKCEDGVETLRNYRRQYNERTSSFMDKPLHDNASNGSDAFRYLALVASQKSGTLLVQQQPSTQLQPTEMKLEEIYEAHEKSPALSMSRRRI